MTKKDCRFTPTKVINIVQSVFNIFVLIAWPEGLIKKTLKSLLIQ